MQWTATAGPLQLPDGPDGHAKKPLCQDEDVVPKSGLKVRLQLGHVEVGARVTLHEGEYIVEEVHAEVEQGAGERPYHCRRCRCRPARWTDTHAQPRKHHV